MVYTAKELLAHLNHLTLSGIDNGYLEWIGTDKQWEAVSDDLRDESKKESDSWDYRTHESM
jgi:hypothetical protein